MTKRELIKALDSFSDDADIICFWVCDNCNAVTLEGIVDLCPNGPSVQLNADSACEPINKMEEELEQIAQYECECPQCARENKNKQSN